ncbi:MAG TPA: sigma-70 family RNA polymerase sigma factor, partial [Hanamia sp.]
MVNNKCEAEDIASAAFIKIWKRHNQFDNAKNIRAYLYQIVRNDCLKFLQQNDRRNRTQKEIEYLTIGDTKDNCEADIIRAELYSDLYKALKNLPTEC